MRWAAAFSSSPVAHRLGFSRPSSSATIRTVVQSLMEPSHNDPLNHMPAHLSCNFGAPQPRQQRWCSFGTLCNLASNFRWSRSTSSATSAVPVILASNFGAPSHPHQQLRPGTSAHPVIFASNLGGPSQPRQQLRRSPSTSTTFSRVLPLQYVKREHSVNHRVSRLPVRHRHKAET